MASTALILAIGACSDEDLQTAPCAYKRTLRKRPARAIYSLPMAGNGSANRGGAEFHAYDALTENAMLEEGPAKSLKYLVEREGLEPSTPAL
jgi:hypothetical protein